MASSPRAFSPAGSPPHSGNTPLPSKKRGAELGGQSSSAKRRKPSVMSIASAGSVHPLRQTSFPPDESQSQVFSPSHRRSPSVDAMSLVSGSQVSGAPARKKRGRKSKAERATEAAAEASQRSGTAGASTANGGKAGKDDNEDEGEGGFEVPENMASKAADRTKEQIREEEANRALLTNRMDPGQFDRYEVWHRASLKIGDVKRHINSVTSQSCPINVQQMMQVVCKMYMGDIVEEARQVQEQWRKSGEEQTELPDDGKDTEGDLSHYRRHPPLRPDHLREAYRRRKSAAEYGGAMGSRMFWNQQTQNGSERFAARAGGRRVFK